MEKNLLEKSQSHSFLTIDLDAITENYRTCLRLSGRAKTAAVVKADAYGLGAVEVARALASEGCEDFFVAIPEEGLELHEALSESAGGARIYILDGLLPRTSAMFEEMFQKKTLIPCLNSIEEIEEWHGFCRRMEKSMPALWHIDTGINRLGLGGEALDYLQSHPELMEVKPSYVMSHFACADESGHPMTAAQETRFKASRQRLGLEAIPASFANSAALIEGKGLYEMTRPGVSLYGGDPFLGRNGKTPFRPVLRLEGIIQQLRTLQAGDGVGYGARWRAAAEATIATVPIGYADGYMRHFWQPQKGAEGVMAVLHGQKVPIVGTISMDMITLDISSLEKGRVKRGDRVELLGEGTTINDIARLSHQVPHTILTGLGGTEKGGLGKRLPRGYISSQR